MPAPATEDVNWGETHTYTATPSPGYNFVRWNTTPNLEYDHGNELKITLDHLHAKLNTQEITISAVFAPSTPPAPPTYNITITPSPSDAGTAKAIPARAAAGARVRITPQPADGYKLASITATGPNGRAIPVNASGEFEMPAGNVAVQVEFEIADVHEIKVTVYPEGAGTVIPTPAKAAEGKMVKLSPQPADGYKLASITATGPDGKPITVNEYGEFQMPSGDVTVRAEFEIDEDWPEHNITVTVSPDNAGTATASPTKAAEGETVKITTQAADGYKLASITATDADGKPITVNKDGEFTMPAGAVTVLVEFEIDEREGADVPITGFLIKGLPSGAPENSTHELEIVWTTGGDADAARAAGLAALASGVPEPAPVVTWSVSPANGPLSLSITPRGADGATLTIGKAADPDAPAQQCALTVEVSQKGGFYEKRVCTFYAGRFLSPVDIPEAGRNKLDDLNAELAKDGVFITPGNNAGPLEQSTLDAVAQWLRDCLITYGTTPERNTDLTPIVQLDAIGGINDAQAEETDTSSLPPGYEDAEKRAPYLDMALPGGSGDAIEALPMTYSVRFTLEELASAIGSAKASDAVADPAANLGAIFDGIVLHLRTIEGPMGFGGPNGSYYTRLLRGIANPEEALKSGMLSLTSDGTSITLTLSFFLLNYHGEAFIVDGFLFVPDGLYNDRLIELIWAHRREAGAEPVLPGGGDGGGGGCASQAFPAALAAIAAAKMLPRRRSA